VRAQQGRDALFAGVGLAAGREFAVDHGAAQRAFGVIVGRLHTGMAVTTATARRARHVAPACASVNAALPLPLERSSLSATDGHNSRESDRS
jgi:hypothetical protein